MLFRNQTINLDSCNGVPISIATRDEWIVDAINHLLSKSDYRNGETEMTYTTSGDSLVLVSMNRESNGEIYISVHDCKRVRGNLYKKLIYQPTPKLRTAGQIVDSEQIRDFNDVRDIDLG